MVNKISRAIIGFDRWHLELVRNQLIHDFLRERGLSIEVMKIILVMVFHVDLSKFSLQLLDILSISSPY